MNKNVVEKIYDIFVFSRKNSIFEKIYKLREKLNKIYY